MGKKTLSNPRTRVTVRYERRLARMERQVQALRQRLNIELAIRLREIAKVNFSGETVSQDLSASVMSAVRSAEVARAMRVDFSASKPSIQPRKVAWWRRLTRWWFWRHLITYIFVFAAVWVIMQVLSHVD